MVSDFFFQAEDSIRDSPVTGVQTCALPIFIFNHFSGKDAGYREGQQSTETEAGGLGQGTGVQIGRASCRERV